MIFPVNFTLIQAQTVNESVINTNLKAGIIFSESSE